MENGDGGFFFEGAAATRWPIRAWSPLNTIATLSLINRQIQVDANIVPGARLSLSLCLHCFHHRANSIANYDEQLSFLRDFPDTLLLPKQEEANSSSPDFGIFRKFLGSGATCCERKYEAILYRGITSRAIFNEILPCKLHHSESHIRGKRLFKLCKVRERTKALGFTSAI